ncbi:MAG TPA: energy transducer TonB, partial [Flavipsychrobacter sp.]|nr:energy transducer TonB [Flavipsychrobacter sp.]
MKYILFALGAMVTFSLSATAQDAAHNEQGAAAQVLTYAEQMPEPTVNLSKFLAKNLRYPEVARKQNVEGKVTVGFVVDTTGQVKDVTVVRSVDALLDSESVRVVRLMPRWKPGVQDGRVVTVYKTLPISFRINEHQLMELAKPTDGDIFKYVDKEPKPTFDLDSFISANLQFPEPEKTNGIYGT